jgi:pilus assembly protein CpaC
MNAQPASGAPRLLSPLRATALFMAVMVAAPHAQVLQGTVARAESTPTAAAADPEVSQVQLLVGHSTVVNVGQAITRVSLTSPTIADAMVTAPQQLLVHGKAPGSISLFVWDRAGGIKRFAVNVQRDLSALQHQVKTLFPGEPISVYGNGKDVVVAGTVSSKYVIEKAAEVAAGYVEKKEDVVNLLKQEEGLATQQVLLRVRFAEVSRNAMTELGVSMFANGTKDGRWFGRTATDQVPGPDFVADQSGTKLVFSDFLNLFLFDAKNNVGAVVRALQNKGLFQSLAEPNLIAENGKEASFLAGGEYPYPVVQGGGDRAVTIVFKEFGIKLNFTPTIVGGDLVKLKVRPEVSSLDFANAILLEGFRVPAISTRRTETEVELRDGQTFAIAGLMNNTVTSTMSKIPGIGDIPILGLLFRSKAAQKSQTELVVMITPQILRRNSTGVSSAAAVRGAAHDPAGGTARDAARRTAAGPAGARRGADRGAARGGASRSRARDRRRRANEGAGAHPGCRARGGPRCIDPGGRARRAPGEADQGAEERDRARGQGREGARREGREAGREGPQACRRAGAA